jgi:hypothetical protein
MKVSARDARKIRDIIDTYMEPVQDLLPGREREAPDVHVHQHEANHGDDDGEIH